MQAADRSLSMLRRRKTKRVQGKGLQNLWEEMRPVNDGSCFRADGT